MQSDVVKEKLTSTKWHVYIPKTPLWIKILRTLKSLIKGLLILFLIWLGLSFFLLSIVSFVSNLLELLK